MARYKTLTPPFPGALTTVEAAVVAGRTRQAITHAVRVGALKATKEEGPLGRVWIDSMDLRRAYPPALKASGKHRLWNLPPKETDALLGFTPNVDGEEHRPALIEGLKDTPNDQ